MEAEDLSLVEAVVVHRLKAVAAAVMLLEAAEEAEVCPCWYFGKHGAVRPIYCRWRKGCLEHREARPRQASLGPRHG